MLRALLLLSCVVLLAACASSEYNPANPQNQMVAPISMPPGTSSSKIHSYYPVAAAPKGQVVQKPSLLPPGAKRIKQ